MDTDLLVKYSQSGTTLEKLTRGGFLGLGLGIALSLLMCCWIPCCRTGGFLRAPPGTRRIMRRERQRQREREEAG